MSPAEFGEMRLGDFFLKLIGYRKNQLQDWEFHGQTARFSTFWIMRSMTDSGPKKPEDLWGLPSEEKDEVISVEMGKAENIKNMINVLK